MCSQHIRLYLNVLKKKICMSEYCKTKKDADNSKIMRTFLVHILPTYLNRPVLSGTIIIKLMPYLYVL